jgi:hypothetical protein
MKLSIVATTLLFSIATQAFVLPRAREDCDQFLDGTSQGAQQRLQCERDNEDSSTRRAVGVVAREDRDQFLGGASQGVQQRLQCERNN